MSGLFRRLTLSSALADARRAADAIPAQVQRDLLHARAHLDLADRVNARLARVPAHSRRKLEQTLTLAAARLSVDCLSRLSDSDALNERLAQRLGSSAQAQFLLRATGLEAPGSDKPAAEPIPSEPSTENEPAHETDPKSNPDAPSQDEASEADELAKESDSESVDDLASSKRAERPDQLRETTEALLIALAEPLDKLRVIQSSRARRLWVSVGLLLALTVLAVVFWPNPPPGPNIALGKPWESSSVLSGFTRTGTLTETPDQDFFFSTQRQKAPHLIVDLGPGATIIGWELTNRRECCFDRAIPLSVAVSDDKKEWREIAKRTDPFFQWRHLIEPTQARYLRIQVEKQSWLHLYEVKVFGPR